MPADSKKIPAVFYKTTSGSEPVRDWLRGSPPQARRILGQDIARVEYGWPIGMPTCKPLGDGLYEVRSDLPDGRIAWVVLPGGRKSRVGSRIRQEVPKDVGR